MYTRWDGIREGLDRGVPLDNLSRGDVVALWHDAAWLATQLEQAVKAHIKITSAMRVGGRTPERALDQMQAIRRELHV